MISHVIYHIVGRKVGCTKNLKKRKARYLRDEGSLPDIKILVELHDASDQEAGDIEQIWNTTFGYRGQSHYKDTIEANRIAAFRLNEMLTPDRKREIGRIAGARAVELKKTGFLAMSPEKRKIEGKKGGRTTAAIPGHLSRAGHLGGVTAVRLLLESGKAGTQNKGTCVYCGVEMSLASLGRYHND